MEPLFTPDVHVFYEHTPIPLAIYYVDENGKFKAYLVSEGACRMYGATAEEIMDRLNGDDPFVNIPEKEEMIKAVRAFSENGEKYNVVYHERVYGGSKEITIHCVGEHEYTRDGRRYSIVTYDEISDSSRKFLFREEEKQIEEKQKLFYEIDDAIARSYTSVIYVDSDTREVTSVRLNRFGRTLVEEAHKDPHIGNVIDLYVKTFVYRDDAEEVRRFGDFDYVLSRLKETNPIFHTYRTIRDGRIVYYRLKIIPFDGGRKVVYGFEHFDAQIREKLARESEHETQMTLLAGLSCEYECIWLLDTAINHARLIRNNIDKSSRLNEMYGATEGSYDAIVESYIDTYVVPEDRERLFLLTSMENLIRNTKEDEIFHIDYCRKDPEGVKNHIQLCFARVVDDMGVIRFVCGFRNVDAMIEEEKNRNLLYSMANMDHMTKFNNRRVFDEHMDKRKGRKLEDDFVFFTFDLNQLKEANDDHGHEAGDELITGAARCIEEVLGQYGSLYRTGGDEFAALVNLASDKRAAVISKLKKSFENWKGTVSSGLSISMGYAATSEDAEMTIDDLRRTAENRMYSQKTDYYMQDGHDRRRGRKGGN